MRNRGFSLIELMIVVAIAGVLMLFVSPSLRDWMVNVRIRNTANTLEEGMQRARTEAISRNQTVAVWLVTAVENDSKLDNTCALSTTSGSWVVSLADPTSHCKSTEPTVIALHAMGDGAEKVTITAGANCLAFDGLGKVNTATVCATAADAVKIDVKSAVNAADYRSLCVEVFGGAPRVCDPKLSATTDFRACKNACSN